VISVRALGAKVRLAWAIGLSLLALFTIAIIVDHYHILPAQNAQTEDEPSLATLPPVTSTVPQAAVAIDPEAVLELQALLQTFVPVAQAHDIGFDAELLTALERETQRLGINPPVAVRLEGETASNYGTGIEAVYLPDDAAAVAADLTGAAEAWVVALSAAPSITRIQGSATDGSEATRARTAFAPASRSGVRAGQPVTTAVVRQISDAFDTWLTNEAHAAYEAEAQRIADLRARMVALSRAAGNGRLPAQALCPIPFSPRFSMRCDVIDSLVDLNNAFRAHFGRDLVVSSGYRANPGTSNHGWGLAIDFGGQMTSFGTAEFNWMNANARQFGWGHAFWAVPGGLNPQPWHWEAMDQIREMTGSWR